MGAGGIGLSPGSQTASPGEYFNTPLTRGRRVGHLKWHQSAGEVRRVELGTRPLQPPPGHFSLLTTYSRLGRRRAPPAPAAPRPQPPGVCGPRRLAGDVPGVPPPPPPSPPPAASAGGAVRGLGAGPGRPQPTAASRAPVPAPAWSPPPPPQTAPSAPTPPSGAAACGACGARCRPTCDARRPRWWRSPAPW